MTLDDATAAITTGEHFGVIYPLLAADDDRAELKAWYVGTPGVPVNPWNPGKPPARFPGYRDDACGTCGAMTLRQNGTCTVCDSCGSTTGCS